MKKILFFASAFACVALVSCSGNGEKPNGSSDSTKEKNSTEKIPAINGKYKIKSGIITMNSETMGMIQKIIMYFDDYGNKECVETKGEMDLGVAGKIPFNNVNITSDGYIYNIDMTSKTGTKTKIKSFGNSNNIDFSNLTEEMMKQMKITKQGTEVFIGKTCEKYTLEDPALKMKSSYWVWNGIPMKTEMNMAGVIVKVIVTKIEENCTISAEKFIIPKDIKFTEKTNNKSSRP